jgi:hypothetical protein
VSNFYALDYLTWLLPMPPRVKAEVQRALKAVPKLGQLSFWLPLGNLYIVAQRPDFAVEE